MEAAVNVQDFFSSLYNYREYLKQSVSRDLKKKYKRSALGYIWSMLQPLLMMTILAVVFSNIMGTRMEDYPVFLFCGMIVWDYFSACVNGSMGTIRGNMSIISQVPVPKYLFSLSTAMSSFVNFFLSLVPLLVIMAVMGRDFHLTMLALPIVLIPLFIFSMGVALIVATACVFFDDTVHLTGLVLRAVYFLCPILYDRTQLPAWLIPYVSANPIFNIIEFMRGLFYSGTLPDPATYFLCLGGSLAMLFIGLWVFKKSDDKFIYFV
jgi:ABC-type polysaccharide/polyol phosphate export permease